jgi:chromosome segregation ATPase
MKYTRILSLFIVVLSLFFGKANAQTVAQPVSIDVLKAREALLKETTNLNKLKIKFANSRAEIPKLEAEVNRANDRSTKSAVKSKELSTKMSANTGDGKAAQRASKSAKTAYNDARKAQKSTDKLKSAKQKIAGLESDIEKSKAKIAKMDEQLKFNGTVN